MLARIGALALCVPLAGCATPDRKTDNPDRSKLGVLVIAGEGLNSRYDNLKASAALFVVSQKFAESAYSEIKKRGTEAQLYINRDRNVGTRKFVAELLADNKRDGLVQVTVTHVKSNIENTINLTASYIPIEWRRDAQGESVLTKSGPIATYKLLGHGEDSRNKSLTQLARKFVDDLYKTGYVGEE